MTDQRSSTGSAALADEFTQWVEKYAAKVCPPGCLPLPAQEREINLFARMVVALRGVAQAQTGSDTAPYYVAWLEAIEHCNKLKEENYQLRNAQRPEVRVKPMRLSDGRTDYFVSIKVGDRDVTPHVFREEYKAAYHVALYDWLLNGAGEEPDMVEFGPDDWPRVAPAQPTQDGDKGEADARYWEFREKVEKLVFDPIRRGGRVEDEILAELERMSQRDAEALATPQPTSNALSEILKHVRAPNRPISERLDRIEEICTAGEAGSNAYQPTTYVKTLEDLVQCLIDNDPEDLIADGGIRVIDGWRKDAERALSLPSTNSQQSSDAQIDAAYANGVRAVLNRLDHLRKPQDEAAWQDCEAMWRNREAERRASRLPLTTYCTTDGAAYCTEHGGPIQRCPTCPHSSTNRPSGA